MEPEEERSPSETDTQFTDSTVEQRKSTVMSDAQRKMTIQAAKMLAQGGPVSTRHLKVANSIVKDEIRKDAATSSSGTARVGSVWDRVKNRLGDALKVAAVVSPAASLALTAYQYSNMKKTQAAQAQAQAPTSSPAANDDSDSIIGFACCGEEELAAAMEGGSSERRALLRRTGIHGKKPPFYFPTFAAVGGNTVPHDLYRASIWAKASKLAGGGQPNARQMAAAEKMTKMQLQRAGVHVGIPGASPGRVTR
jgi:hypothetical protein